MTTFRATGYPNNVQKNIYHPCDTIFLIYVYNIYVSVSCFYIKIATYICSKPHTTDPIICY